MNIEFALNSILGATFEEELGLQSANFPSFHGIPLCIQSPPFWAFPWQFGCYKFAKKTKPSPYYSKLVDGRNPANHLGCNGINYPPQLVGGISSLNCISDSFLFFGGFYDPLHIVSGNLQKIHWLHQLLQSQKTHHEKLIRSLWGCTKMNQQKVWYSTSHIV